MAEQIVSILGTAYFHPIPVLLEDLLTQPAPDPNDIQTSSLENGLSAALCILSVVCLESWVSRLRFVTDESAVRQEKNAISCLKRAFPDLPSTQELTECFVLRDLLVHNHLWHLSFVLDAKYQMNLTSAELDKLYGDRKYKACVDPKSRLTKKLCLHAVPIKVDRTDVEKVLGIVWKTLLFLESKNRGLCYVSHLPVSYQGRKRNFAELLDELSAT